MHEAAKNAEDHVMDVLIGACKDMVRGCPRGLCVDAPLQSNASKLLLAIMESRHDGENAERVLRNMSNMAGEL